ncbi:hypothetical protein [Mesorhizobium sp. INR15]|nr:hypothetical protein [Mesorhizobium sp. INR15]
MTKITLDKDDLTANIRVHIAESGRLKYQRALLEFEDDAGAFL